MPFNETCLLIPALWARVLFQCELDVQRSDDDDGRTEEGSDEIQGLCYVKEGIHPE